MERPPIYGLMAEFKTPEDLVAAAEKAYEAGYRRMDAYSPFPVEGLAEAVGFRKNRLPMIVFIGGILGSVGGLSLQYWISVVNYPLNVGGRPYFSVPSFIPVTFETTVLLAALSAVFGMILLNGLPMPYHPVFNVDRFREYASRSAFFLAIEARDPGYDRQKTWNFMESLKPMELVEVPH